MPTDVPMGVRILNLQINLSKFEHTESLCFQNIEILCPNNFFW